MESHERAMPNVVPSCLVSKTNRGDNTCGPFRCLERLVRMIPYPP